MLNSLYIEFAKMDIADINNYKVSGEIKSINDKNNVLSLLAEFKKTSIATDYKEVWLETIDPSPEMIIDKTEPYLNELLKIGEKCHKICTGELQIGYTINYITIAYAKIKKWDDVVRWGELFFSLPANYRDRSTKSDVQAIIKRIERAKKQMASDKT